ncbi:hypothetical protein HBB16_00530 [Pseudonocardia sp. MCCB 268]|nr:hypothetical protein [Pseudonocardia cytotoxica]
MLLSGLSVVSTVQDALTGYYLTPRPGSWRSLLSAGLLDRRRHRPAGRVSV